MAKKLLELSVTDNIRIVQKDEINYTLQVLETGINPKTKEPVTNWRIKGYFDNVRASLMAIIDRDMLIDVDEIKTIGDYLKQVKLQRQKVNELLEEAFK